MKEISHEEFVSLLIEIMNKSAASDLLTIPGIYEIASEYYNNDILDRFAESNEEQDEVEGAEKTDTEDWGKIYKEMLNRKPRR